LRKSEHQEVREHAHSYVEKVTQLEFEPGLSNTKAQVLSTKEAIDFKSVKHVRVD
jgi:CRISPR/Cas system CMR-associated protein Cmr5 small subunit